VGRGRVASTRPARASGPAATLTELPILRGLDDDALLAELAGRFTQRRFAAGAAAEAGSR